MKDEVLNFRERDVCDPMLYVAKQAACLSFLEKFSHQE